MHGPCTYRAQRKVFARSGWARARTVGAVAGFLSMSCAGFAEVSVSVDFESQIRPIFASRCYDCHGDGNQKGGLSLESPAGARQGGDSGVAAYRPGDSAESAMILRVTSDDPGFRMPPKGDPLTPNQIALLKQWIDEGARWADDHEHDDADHSAHLWALERPVQSPLPEVNDSSWVRTPIDAFVLAKLESHGMKPSPEADRRALIRRASLDLTGLPPSPEEVEVFVNDPAPDAYERLIDRLLASPHYGEAQALRWLDGARYADTNGYEKDRPRSIWPYRDWVINAFNRDLPFDRFTIEQLAGDLLPNATLDQRIATGFHRNTMLNEEGGIDTEEFRYEAMVDRVNTTAAMFLGLTMACAQCHSHKYDPITHEEYFRFYAFLNNTDDVEIEVPDAEIAAKRRAIENEIATLVSELPQKFPVADPLTEILTARPVVATSAGNATLSVSEDGLVAVTGESPAVDTYTVEIDLAPGRVTGLTIEVSAESGGLGPGRSDKGNFVLSEAIATLPVQGEEKPRDVKFARADADAVNTGFEAEKAIDGDPKTGWAIDGHGVDKLAPHALSLWFAEPLELASPARLTLRLDQQYGRNHTIARFRVSTIAETIPPSDEPDEVRRARHFDRKFAGWDADLTSRARNWTVATPVTCSSKNHVTFEFLEDNSVLVKGDNPNVDTYYTEFRTDVRDLTAVRIEVLPHPSLPNHGPGRGVIMSAPGDFLLSEVKAAVAPWMAPDSIADIALQNPTADFAAPGRTPEQTLDGKIDTGWSINGQQSRPHAIVYEFAEPVAHDGGTLLKLVLEQYYVHNHIIGRFRVSVTSDPLPVRATGVPHDIETILATPQNARSAEQVDTLQKYYLTVAPELAREHQRIADLRGSMPKFPTTLVLEEREHPRETRIHHRGEFLSPRDVVTPGVPAILPPLPAGAPLNRLTLAQWLVSEENPLTARVTMNRLWQSLFGRGIVASVEDFGTRGDLPTHPELLDWLAVEFMRRGWSMKEMTRMIVLSSTYRQSSRVTPELAERDPENILLARAPRYRVDAETIRDIALSASGLLSEKIGGPSVKPPLPDGALSIVYPGEGWQVAEGDDRYRRGLYVYWKRTLPFPAAGTFDAPARDVACTRRVRSNTPLQALTLLNDPVFMEAARALAGRVMHEASDTQSRIARAFQLCTGRNPDPREQEWIAAFYERQLQRLAETPTIPDSLAAGEIKRAEHAAWTLVCRALLNLDETITRG